MFGIGISEIILIVIAAIVFIGPDKLPEMAKKWGRLVRQYRNLKWDLTHKIYSTPDEKEEEPQVSEQDVDKLSAPEPEEVSSEQAPQIYQEPEESIARTSGGDVVS